MKVISRFWLLDQLHFLYRAAQSVFNHAFPSRYALQPVVVGQFQAFLADVIDIGESDHVHSHFSRWIEAAIFFLQKNALDVQRPDLGSNIGIEATAQPHEFFARTLCQLTLYDVRVCL